MRSSRNPHRRREGDSDEEYRQQAARRSRIREEETSSHQEIDRITKEEADARDDAKMKKMIAEVFAVIHPKSVIPVPNKSQAPTLGHPNPHTQNDRARAKPAAQRPARIPGNHPPPAAGAAEAAPAVPLMAGEPENRGAQQQPPPQAVAPGGEEETDAEGSDEDTVLVLPAEARQPEQEVEPGGRPLTATQLRKLNQLLGTRQQVVQGTTVDQAQQKMVEAMNFDDVSKGVLNFIKDNNGPRIRNLKPRAAKAVEILQTL